MSELLIEAECKETVVTLSFKGKKEKCLVREMNGTASAEYMKAIGDNIDYQIGEDGKAVIKGIKSFSGMESELLSRSLFHDDGKPFSKDEIAELSASAQRKLFTIAQELNTLTEEAKEQVKND